MTQQMKQLAKELNRPLGKVTAAVELLDAGNTIPFIARYRKEVTGEMDEVVLRQLAERLQYLRNLEQRKEEVLKTIAEQGKLTEELEQKIRQAAVLQEVEDLYLLQEVRALQCKIHVLQRMNTRLVSLILTATFCSRVCSSTAQPPFMAAKHPRLRVTLNTLTDSTAGIKRLFPLTVRQRIAFSLNSL